MNRGKGTHYVKRLRASAELVAAVMGRGSGRAGLRELAGPKGQSEKLIQGLVRGQNADAARALMLRERGELAKSLERTEAELAGRLGEAGQWWDGG